MTIFFPPTIPMENTSEYEASPILRKAELELEFEPESGSRSDMTAGEEMNVEKSWTCVEVDAATKRLNSCMGDRVDVEAEGEAKGSVSMERFDTSSVTSDMVDVICFVAFRDVDLDRGRITPSNTSFFGPLCLLLFSFCFVVVWLGLNTCFGFSTVPKQTISDPWSDIVFDPFFPTGAFDLGVCGRLIISFDSLLVNGARLGLIENDLLGVA
jgi:hypothetical protein